MQGIRFQFSCGHTHLQCEDCPWNYPVKFQQQERIVALLTAGGAFPIDDFVREKLDENSLERRKAFAIASLHRRQHHSEGF